MTRTQRDTYLRCELRELALIAAVALVVGLCAAGLLWHERVTAPDTAHPIPFVVASSVDDTLRALDAATAADDTLRAQP